MMLFVSLLGLVLPIQAETGLDAYQKSCASCHGPQGEGSVEKKSPRLAKQHSWYIIIQIDNYNSGIRTKHPLSLKSLSSGDKEAIALYLEKLK